MSVKKQYKINKKISRKPVSESLLRKTKDMVKKPVLLQFFINNSTYTEESLEDRSSLSG